MKWNKLYKYPESTRSLIEGNLTLCLSNEILPSVTTILQSTQSDEKRASLAKWRRKVGENEAEKIRDEAAKRGTAMHEFLEMHLRGDKLLAACPSLLKSSNLSPRRCISRNSCIAVPRFAASSRIFSASFSPTFRLHFARLALFSSLCVL
jgi:hypothetical protein